MVQAQRGLSPHICDNRTLLGLNHRVVTRVRQFSTFEILDGNGCPLAKNRSIRNLWLMKTRNTRLFLELNLSAFVAHCLSLGQARCLQIRLVQLGQVSLKVSRKIEIQKSPCISCLHLPNISVKSNIHQVPYIEGYDFMLCCKANVICLFLGEYFTNDGSNKCKSNVKD